MNATNWVSFSEKGICLFCGLKDTMYKYFQLNNSPSGIFNITNKLMINRKIITRCRIRDRILCFTCYERLIYCDNFVSNIQNSKKNPAEVNYDETKAICCVCRKAHDKPLKSISANGFLNNRELFLTTLLFDIKTTIEDKRIACKSCYNNMINFCNLHRLISLTHPELHSILNRSNITDLKEDFSFKETIILDKKPGTVKSKNSMTILTPNASTINNVSFSKSSGSESESILTKNTDSITIDTSSSSIVNNLGGELRFDTSNIPSVPVTSYKYVRQKPTTVNSAEPFANAEVVISNRLYHLPKIAKLKRSQSKGTKISLPSHKEDDQSYEIQDILLSQTEINVPQKSRAPNRFVRFWRRIFKK